MAEAGDDPREVPWHPRFAARVVGHRAGAGHFAGAFAAGKLHHAWLLTGPRGIGKATLAWKMAGHVLDAARAGRASASDRLVLPPDSATAHWLAGRSHPDLFVLERQLNDGKPRRLKAEISVDDARALSHFFSHTAGAGGWRVAIIDAADDLSGESANALLKLVEEPPPRSLLLMVAHRPGGLLRTLKSRCTRLALAPLSDDEVMTVLRDLPLEPRIAEATLAQAAALSGGSPGRALELAASAGAEAFAAFRQMKHFGAAQKIELANRFAGRTATLDDFNIFAGLLLGWLAGQARERAMGNDGANLAAAHQKISHSIHRTNALNLDRRQAVIDAVTLIDDALRAV
jgi:DNA polymerase-3 subunit delta'